MAKTASVSLSPSTLVPGQVCNATVTVTNADTNAVTVNVLQPYVTNGGTNSGSACNVGYVGFGPNVNNICNGSSGTLSQSFPIDFYAPATKGSGLQNSSDTYTVGCLVMVTDNVTGTVTQVSASTATATVNEPTH